MELHFGCYDKAPRLNSSQKKGFVWAYRSRGMEGHGTGESADMTAGTGCLEFTFSTASMKQRELGVV